jgi:GNAT superfamily N-acetyltransferase
MTANTLPSGYTVRPPIPADAAEIAALIAAVERANGDPPTMSAEELQSDWQGINLAEEAVAVIAPDGSIAAYADLINRRFVQISVYGHVLPALLGRGVGAWLVGWGEGWARERIGRAPEGARVTVQHFVREANAGARALLEAHGYTAVRTHYWMEIALDAPPPAPEWPAGIAVRPFVKGQDDQAVFEAGEEAFRDLWNRPASTFERWMQPTQADDFDPSLWFIAFDEAAGRPAAVCLCSVVAGGGVVNVLGVRRPYRRRGLGLAMLRHAFGVFYARGVREASLSVDADSTTGAPQLYAHAGMRPAKSFVRFEKELRPGSALAE